MCLILAVKPNAPRQTLEQFQSIYAINGDGLGIAYSHNGNLVINKSFEKDIEKFYNYYTNIPPECPILIHFRKCSSGKLIPDNLHPFIVNENLCFAFNGTITKLDFKTDFSDTYVLNTGFVSKIIENDPEAYKSYWFKELFESYIGSSKMVFLNNLGEFKILNEGLGYWNDNEKKEVWYSNNLWSKKSKESLVLYPTRGKIKTYNLKKPHHKSHYNHTTNELVNHRASQVSLLGDLDSIKKKYCFSGDPYLRELSLNQLLWAYTRYHKGVKKLVKRYILRELEYISDDTRYNARIKLDHDTQAQSIELFSEWDQSVDYNPDNEKLNSKQETIIDIPVEKIKTIPLLLPPPAGPLSASIGEILNQQSKNKNN
jgi:hypothetical protein